MATTGPISVKVEVVDELAVRTAALRSAVDWVVSGNTVGHLWATVTRFEDYLRTGKKP